MAFTPQFTISLKLLSLIEQIAALRERVAVASLDTTSVLTLQREMRCRNAHASTAIEGNRLTLEQVRALEAGEDAPQAGEISKREVQNYFRGLSFIEAQPLINPIRHEELFMLHKSLAAGVMHQGEPGGYRTIQVRVGDHTPPHPEEVSGLMWELLDWWRNEAQKLSPVLSSAILHHRFEDIHPFADGNGRTGRMLALWELFRRGFDAHRILAVDEFFWEDRERYYRALSDSRRRGCLDDWLEYCAEGILQSLQRAWLRTEAVMAGQGKPLYLKPRQEKLLFLLREHGSMAPRDIWESLSVSRQGAMNTINPLLEAGVIEKVGGRKSGRYQLTKMRNYPFAARHDSIID